MTIVGGAGIFTGGLYDAFHRERYELLLELAIFVLMWLAGFYTGRRIETDKQTDEKIFNELSSLPAEVHVDVLLAKADEAEAQSWSGFDPDEPSYPEELDIALQAWRAVCNSPATGSVREQLTSWVRISYPHLSGAAVDRIVGVCNWHRTGGRPKLSE